MLVQIVLFVHLLLLSVYPFVNVGFTYNLVD